MLVCNYCKRNFKEKYKNCPGCGSDSFKQVEDKLDYVIETPPTGGYKLVNMGEFKINEKEKNVAINIIAIVMILILLFLNAFFVLFLVMFKFPLQFIIVPLGGDAIFILLIGLLLVGKKKINLTNSKTKREILKERGVLYKNLPYTVETHIWKDSDGDKHTSYKIVIKHKMKDGVERTFKSKGKYSQKDFMSKTGTADLIVDPQDYNNYFVDLEIY